MHDNARLKKESTNDKQFDNLIWDEIIKTLYKKLLENKCEGKNCLPTSCHSPRKESEDLDLMCIQRKSANTPILIKYFYPKKI